MTVTARLAVVTPWYPGANDPFAGAFVQGAVRAVAHRFRHVQIVHSENWPVPPDRPSADLVRHLLRSMSAGPDPRLTPRPVHVREGELLRVPAPVVRRRIYADHAREHEDAVRRALPVGLDADVVHGHVGIYGGWVAARLARPDARVVVTEHATFLDRVLQQRQARRMYDEVIGRCDAFLCVSSVLRKLVLAEFPQYRGKVHVVPNAVAVEAIPARPRPVTALRRWLYVGRLLPHKGVDRLLEVFAVCAREDPALRLTLLGDGPGAPQLAARAAELGVRGRVRLAGPVSHDQVAQQLHEHDVLVHLSEIETFGMTVVEAVAAGLPVLVTRCGGPEETLQGIEQAAGATVPVGDGVDDVVHAFRELRARLAELDPGRARAVVLERYGTASVGARLAQHYGLDAGERV